MATADETRAIREIERRRWVLLRQQIAQAGRDADPADVMEADDLQRKWGFNLASAAGETPPSSRAKGGAWTLDDEVDWIRTMLASALRAIIADREARIMRQRLATRFYVAVVVALLLMAFVEVWIVTRLAAGL